MTSRRKTKRSVSLRASSFIRLLSPFRGGVSEREEDGSGSNPVTPHEVSQPGHEVGGNFTGRPLHAALSDSQLNVSTKSDAVWMGERNKLSGVNDYILQIIQCVCPEIRLIMKG